ncbi:MAG: hypothetical protein ACYC35_21715 [Pirellulales bacterium]
MQEWSDTCRRCRCDLRLLQQMAEEAGVCRDRCLRALQTGHVSQAAADARRLYALRPDPLAARLLAVCYLLQGNWPAAATLARIANHGS